MFRVTYAFDDSDIVYSELINADDIYQAYDKFLEIVNKEFDLNNLIAFSLYKTEEFLF